MPCQCSVQGGFPFGTLKSPDQLLCSGVCPISESRIQSEMILTPFGTGYKGAILHFAYYPAANCPPSSATKLELKQIIINNPDPQPITVRVYAGRTVIGGPYQLPQGLTQLPPIIASNFPLGTPLVMVVNIKATDPSNNPDQFDYIEVEGDIVP